jgi:thioredoxin 1
MIEVTDEVELAKLLKANSKVVALFYSSWCPFCRSFISTFDKHAKNPASHTYIKVQIDDDDNPMWETYSLDAVPSLILFEKGQVSKRLDCARGVGLSEKQFTKWLGAF